LIAKVLAECHVALKQSGGFVQLKLTENWLREYQVLPGRTHPFVTMSSNGGFLLSGVKVEGCGERPGGFLAPRRAPKSDASQAVASTAMSDSAPSVNSEKPDGIQEAVEVMDVAQ
jgi:tRNA (adenine-N(1)-)-methyltransferase non-catalytic subunit